MNPLSDEELTTLLIELDSDRAQPILNEKRRHRDIPYDIRPRPSAQLADLSRTYFEEEYLPGAFAPDILAANERSYEQRLAAYRERALEAHAEILRMGQEVEVVEIDAHRCFACVAGSARK